MKTKENSKKINDFLKEIGLWRNEKPLAYIRDFSSGPNYDLILSISPEDAVKRLKTKLKISDNDIDFSEYDGSQYWDYRIENNLHICIEDYVSGSWYLQLTDLSYDTKIVEEDLEIKHIFTAAQAQELYKINLCVSYDNMIELYDHIKTVCQKGRNNLYVKIEDKQTYQIVFNKLIAQGYNVFEFNQDLIKISW